jgi:hypothetical protein
LTQHIVVFEFIVKARDSTLISLLFRSRSGWSVAYDICLSMAPLRANRVMLTMLFVAMAITLVQGKFEVRIPPARP